PQLVALDNVDFGRFRVTTRQQDSAAARRIQTADDDRRRHQSLYFAARNARPRRVHGAIVDDDETEPLAVRTKLRRADATVQIFRGFEWRGRGASVGGHEGEVVHA